MKDIILPSSQELIEKSKIAREKLMNVLLSDIKKAIEDIHGLELVSRRITFNYNSIIIYSLTLNFINNKIKEFGYSMEKSMDVDTFYINF